MRQLAPKAGFRLKTTVMNSVVYASILNKRTSLSTKTQSDQHHLLKQTMNLNLLPVTMVGSCLCHS